MAEIRVKNAFVEELIGSPVFVVKVAEPHSKKDEAGKYETVGRTFMDLKVSKKSGIDLSQFQKGDRVRFKGSQFTDVREYQGKKYYTLTVWVDEIAFAEGFQRSAQSAPVADGWAQSAQDLDAPF